MSIVHLILNVGRNGQDWSALRSIRTIPKEKKKHEGIKIVWGQGAEPTG